MKFTKMQGIGNDYVYVNCFEETVADPERVSEIISDRHFGIGADGLVLIMPSDKADFRMRMFNADGSEGNMCGNATRCIGKFVYDNHLTDKTSITLETRSGIKKLTLYPENGKVKTVLQMLTIIFYYFAAALAGPTDVGVVSLVTVVLCWLCGAATLLSGCIYLWQNRQLFMQAK